MKQFEGFPARMQFTPVPNLFINNVMSSIDDITELKTTLHIFRLIYTKKGNLRYVSFTELLADNGLMESLGRDNGEPQEMLSAALEKAVKRKTVIRLEFENEGSKESLYFINTADGRKTVEKIRNGELVSEVIKKGKPLPVVDTEPLPDIFTLYEENVGLLSPMVADWLKEAEKLYPESWIRDAIKEAVSLNKRNWRYIDRILENWSAEGRKDGTYRGNPKTGTEKYGNQKYGHMVRH